MDLLSVEVQGETNTHAAERCQLRLFLPESELMQRLHGTVCLLVPSSVYGTQLDSLITGERGEVYCMRTY